MAGNSSQKIAPNNEDEVAAVEADIQDKGNGWEVMEKEMEKSKEKIEKYLSTLDRGDIVRIVVELAANGDASVEYLKDTLEASRISEEEIDPTASFDPTEDPGMCSKPNWCVCKVCQEMPTGEEEKCCRKKKCVISYVLFRKLCLDRDNLVLNIKARSDIRAEEFDFSTNSFRKAAYRQFILWKYGKLGKGNRRVIPSCVVRIVRQHYPSPDDVYMGFRNR